VARTIIIEPILYCRRLDNCVDLKRNKELAEGAWADFAQHNPDVEYSFDFEKGFKFGYEDFLYAGGSGQPPPVPPRYYWRPEFESGDGHRAIEDWYAGYARGAEAARESGYRQLVTVPASVALPDPLPSTNAPQANLGVPRPDGGALPGKEMLPPPRDESKK
jgi:hypothetical protein